MQDREIILALFNPQTDHAKGCLVNDPHIKPRGPCICGFPDAVRAYNEAIKAARKIADEHYGSSFAAREAPPHTSIEWKLTAAGEGELHALETQ